jgi:ABC-type transporter MlaC component
LRRLQARYNGEQVFYVGQTPISKSHARVEILVLWKNLEVPVDLRMMHRNGTWKVYDISALGISAVGNYRAQFHSILKKKSPEKVIDVLREKIRKIDEQI